MSVQAVVFDLDGVLISSESWWDEVRRSTATASGRPWPEGATRALQGMSTQEWSAYLTDTVGVAGTPAEVAEQVIDQMVLHYQAQLPLLPGALTVVHRLAQRWPLGLASSSPRRLIDVVLDAAGLTASFQVTASTEQVAEGKPSPAVYLRVAQQLGVDPGQAVAIEDSSNGLRSAAAAGFLVLAVPHADFPPAADALALADHQVAALTEVSVDLIARLTRRSGRPPLD